MTAELAVRPAWVWRLDKDDKDEDEEGLMMGMHESDDYMILQG